MKKRFYMMLLALAMITTLAVPAFAADTSPYGLYVGGVAVTTENAGNVLGDGTVSYDADGNSVALNGAAINNAAGPGIEYTGTGTLTVKFSGSGNTITGTDGIKSSGSISLNVGWDSITGTNGAGISAVNDIEIVGTDKVGGTITGNGSGVFAGGDITIESYANVSSIKAELGNGIAAGTYGKITIAGKVGSITAAQRCISTQNVTISGEVGDITGSTYGIYASDSVSITGKVGNIKVERADDNYSYGIRAGGNVAISGEVGDITVTAAATGAYGIYARKDIEIEKNNSGENSLGDVSATTQAADKKAYGLYAGGSITVQPGATTGAISGTSYGLYAGGSITVQPGATTGAISGTSCGIYAGGSDSSASAVMLIGKIGAITGGIEAVGDVQLAGTIAGNIDSINASKKISIRCNLTDGVEIGKIVSRGGEIVITGIVGTGSNKIGEIISETDIVAIAGDVYSAIGLIKGQKDVGILAAGTITGTGTGNVTGNIGSISAPDGDVIISGKVTGDIGGITADADVTISGTVNGDISGITAGGDVEISGTVGEVESTTGHGISAGGNVTIAGTVGDIAGAGDRSGIHAPNGKITLGDAGSTTVIGTITGGGSYGIYGNAVEINADLVHVSGIWSTTDLTLSKKINSIINNNGYGIYSGGNITISGTIGFQGATGPVLSGSTSGIYAVGNLTIESTATVGDITATAGYGISADGSDPEGGVSLKIAGKVGDIIGAANGSGICAPYGSIKITGTVGKIKGAATDAEDDLECIGIGIQAYGNITIESTATVDNITATEAGIFAQGKTIEISGTVRDITVAGGNGVGIKAIAGSITISGTVGKITAPGTDGWGILADGAVQIAAGGTVAGIDAGRIGIYSSSGTTIAGQLGPVKAGSTGISAGSVTITGQVTGIQATDNRGISASGKITLGAKDDGDPSTPVPVTVIGTITGGSYGIYGNAVEINADLGTVSGIYSESDLTLYKNIAAIDNKNGHGIYSGGDITISGTIGTAEATGPVLSGTEDGIHAENGTITISGTVGKITGGTNGHGICATATYIGDRNVEISGTVGDITGGGHGIHAETNVTIDGTVGKITGGTTGINAGKVITISGTVGDVSGGTDGFNAYCVTVSGKIGTAGSNAPAISGGTTGINVSSGGVKITGTLGDIAGGSAGYGIYAQYGGVALGSEDSESAAIIGEITGGTGIYTYSGDVTIAGTATLGDITATNGHGIHVDGKVTITGTVGNITGGATGHGISAGDKVIISGTVGDIKGGTAAASTDDPGSHGIYSGVQIDLGTSGSTTKIGDITGGGSGLYTTGMVQLDGDLTVGDITGTSGYGIYAKIGLQSYNAGDVTLGDITGSTAGIYVGGIGAETVNNGIVQLYGTVGIITAENGHGIYGEDNVVLYGKVTGIAATGGDGIYSPGALTLMSGSEIEAITATSGHGIHAGEGINPQGTIGTITAGKNGIYVENSNVLISGSVDYITTTGGDGIYAGGDITIASGATLGDIKATGGSGIHGITVTISGTVGNIDASAGYHGITGDTITISRNGAVGNIKVGSNYCGIWSFNPSGSAQVTIAGTLGDITGGKTGIYVYVNGSITVEDTGVVGDIDVTNYGIQANGDITISGTVDSVTATGTGGYGDGIYSTGDITIESGATLGDIKANQAGIHANGGDITISGVVGDIDVTADGICAIDGDITISGTVGNVKASGGYAITAGITSSDGPGGNITISGTTGILTADTAHKYRAISGGSTVTITDTARIGNTDPESDTVDVVGSIFANKDVTIAAPLTVSTEEEEAVQSMNGQIILQGVMVKSGALNGPQVELVAGSPVVAIPMYYPAVSPASGGSVKAIPLAVSEGSAVTLLVTPEEGRELVSLTVTDASGRTVPVEQIGENRWRFVQPDSKITVTPVFARAESPMDRYVDLDPDAWYRAGVEFVLEQGLMIGTGADRFSPEGTLDRAQVLTVLWRLEGSPASDSVHYTDVPEHEWYADAVSWASDLGLALGHGNGTFGPEDPLTLEQLAAFLHRYAQLKQGGITETSLSAAMNWAEAQSLLAGMEQVTSPTAPALRTQIAWMLKGLLDQ